MNKPYAIFDMDGTLVDSMGFWKRLAFEYLESHGVTDVSAEILERIKPMTMTESAALFIKEYGLPGTPESVASDMNAMMDDHYRSDIPLKPGVKEYLTKLKTAGVRMCVASATAEPLMEACLGRLGVLKDFEFLLSCETVGAGKKQPDVYLESIRRMGAKPEETAVYEDAVYAAETAKRAGFYVAGVQDESTASCWEPEDPENPDSVRINCWEKMKRLADEVIEDWNAAAEEL